MKAIARGLSPSRKEWQSNDWLALPQKLLIDKKQISCRKRKLPSQTNSCFRWFGSYNMRKIFQKSIPNPLLCSCDLLSPWRCKALEPFEKQSRTETKSKISRDKMQPAHFRSCWDLPLVFPWRLEGGWKDKAELEPKEPRRAPCSGAPRVVQIHDSLHNSPRRSR